MFSRPAPCPYIVSVADVPLTQMLKPTWYLWVVGGSVFVLVLLLVSLVLVPYLLWRHRVILVMKIVHYFQGYEDEGKWMLQAFFFHQVYISHASLLSIPRKFTGCDRAGDV